MARIGIGTASWGEPYAGKQPPSMTEIDKILDYARASGIDLIDTAPAYKLPEIDFTGFKVVQKTPYEGECYALLQHDPDGEIPKHDRAGISVYKPSQLMRVIDKIKIVQLPLNISNRVFLPYLPELRKRGIEIHARSVFLRGVLLYKWAIEDCLRFVLKQDVDYIIIGINRVEELEGILRDTSCNTGADEFDTVAGEGIT